MTWQIVVSSCFMLVRSFAPAVLTAGRRRLVPAVLDYGPRGGPGELPQVLQRAPGAHAQLLLRQRLQARPHGALPPAPVPGATRVAVAASKLLMRGRQDADIACTAVLTADLRAWHDVLDEANLLRRAAVGLPDCACLKILTLYMRFWC